MSKGINTVINDTKIGVGEVLNASQLPISVVAMIVKEIYTQLKAQEEYVIRQEKQAEQDENNKPKQEVVPIDFKDEVR